MVVSQSSLAKAPGSLGFVSSDYGPILNYDGVNEGNAKDADDYVEYIEVVAAGRIFNKFPDAKVGDRGRPFEEVIDQALVDEIVKSEG